MIGTQSAAAVCSRLVWRYLITAARPFSSANLLRSSTASNARRVHGANSRRSRQAWSTDGLAEAPTGSSSRKLSSADSGVLRSVFA